MFRKYKNYHYKNVFQKKCNNNLILYSSLTIVAFLYSFFSFRFLNENMVKMANMILALIILLLSLPKLVSRENYRNGYTLYIRGITLISVFSIFSSWIFEDQSVILGFRVSYYLFFIGLFFTMLEFRIPLDVIEKFIFIMGIAYCVAWTIGFVTIPSPLFGSFRGEEEGIVDLERGIARMYIPGKATLVLAFFLSLTKFSYEGKKKYLLVGILFYIFIVLQLVRQIITLSLVIGILFLLKKAQSRIYVLIILGVIYISGINNYISDNIVVHEMSKLTVSQLDAQTKEDNIRIKAYKFFFSEYKKNIVTVFLGNGIPHTEGSYGQRLKRMNESGYYLSDVGYPMMYVVTGLVGLFFYLAVFLLCSLRHCRKEYMFARLFMIYFLFANVTAAWYAKVDGVICICICVYLLGNDYYKCQNFKFRKSKNVRISYNPDI